MGTLALRDATVEDMDLIFKWRNDPWIISLGSSGQSVTKEEHQNWYGKAMNDDGISMSIISIDDEEAGQIRFSRESDGIAVVTIYLMKPFTGQGYGVEALKKGCDKIFKAWPVQKIEAYIQDTNEPSIVAFEKAGFQKSDKPSCDQKDHVCYVFKVEG